MRLYLSSYRFGNDPSALKALAPKARVGLIMNALDDQPDRKGNWRTTQLINLVALGFNVEDVDLRSYFGNAEELRKKLLELDMVWVNDGNAFILKRAMEKSGFDNIIKDLIEEDKIVYAGFSAGILVTGPSMEGLDLIHDPNVVPKGYPKNKPENGLGLVPFSIAPRFESGTIESRSIENAISYFKDNEIPFETLRDGQAFVVKGDLSSIEIAG